MKGKIIRFVPSKYSRLYQRQKNTNKCIEILEGRIVKENPDGSFDVQVIGVELPFYVTHPDIIRE